MSYCSIGRPSCFTMWAFLPNAAHSAVVSLYKVLVETMKSIIRMYVFVFVLLVIDCISISLFVKAILLLNYVNVFCSVFGHCKKVLIWLKGFDISVNAVMYVIMMDWIKSIEEIQRSEVLRQLIFYYLKPQ